MPHRLLGGAAFCVENSSSRLRRQPPLRGGLCRAGNLSASPVPPSLGRRMRACEQTEGVFRSYLFYTCGVYTKCKGVYNIRLNLCGAPCAANSAEKEPATHHVNPPVPPEAPADKPRLTRRSVEAPQAAAAGPQLGHSHSPSAPPLWRL